MGNKIRSKNWLATSLINWHWFVIGTAVVFDIVLLFTDSANFLADLGITGASFGTLGPITIGKTLLYSMLVFVLAQAWFVHASLVTDLLSGRKRDLFGSYVENCFFALLPAALIAIPFPVPFFTVMVVLFWLTRKR